MNEICPKCKQPCLKAELNAYNGICENCSIDGGVNRKELQGYTGNIPTGQNVGKAGRARQRRINEV